VSRTSRLVQDDSANRNVGVELLTPEDQRAHSSRRLRAVDRKNDRAFQQLGQFGCAVTALGIHPVEQATVAFDHCDV